MLYPDKLLPCQPCESVLHAVRPNLHKCLIVRWMATGRVEIKYAIASTAHVLVLSSGITGWGNNAEGMAQLSLLFTWYAWFVANSGFAEDKLPTLALCGRALRVRPRPKAAACASGHGGRVTLAVPSLGLPGLLRPSLRQGLPMRSLAHSS